MSSNDSDGLGQVKLKTRKQLLMIRGWSFSRGPPRTTSSSMSLARINLKSPVPVTLMSVKNPIRLLYRLGPRVLWDWTVHNWWSIRKQRLESIRQIWSSNAHQEVAGPFLHRVPSCIGNSKWLSRFPRGEPVWQSFESEAFSEQKNFGFGFNYAAKRWSGSSNV